MKDIDIKGGTVNFSGANGDQIEGYLAIPVDEGSRGNVVVIHHMPGYDRATKEIALRFASMGYNALCPNLHYREAPSADSDDAAAASRANGGVPDERLIGDVQGAKDYLAELPSSNGKFGVIGYCSGGRQTFLAACNIEFDAAVDCYGAFIVNNPAPEFPVRMNAIADQAPNLTAKLLGLFGVEDQNPSPEEVGRLDEILTELGKVHEFHTMENAGHGFFATDRPSYRVEAANRGWELIRDFFAENL